MFRKFAISDSIILFGRLFDLWRPGVLCCELQTGFSRPHSPKYWSIWMTFSSCFTAQGIQSCGFNLTPISAQAAPGQTKTTSFLSYIKRTKNVGSPVDYTDTTRKVLLQTRGTDGKRTQPTHILITPNGEPQTWKKNSGCTNSFHPSLTENKL